MDKKTIVMVAIVLIAMAIILYVIPALSGQAVASTAGNAPMMVGGC